MSFWPWSAPEPEPEEEDEVAEPDSVNAMLHYTELHLTVGVRQDGMVQLISVPKSGRGAGTSLTFTKGAALYIASALTLVAKAIPDPKPEPEVTAEQRSTGGEP